MMNACRPLATLFALSLSVLCAASKGQASDSSLAVRPTLEDLRNLPLGFEANQGQADPAVRFLARGAGYGIYVTEHEIVLAILPGSHEHGRTALQTGELHALYDVVRMKLVGANATAHPNGLDRLPGVANYFIGNDPSKWRTGVPTYAKVRYPEVYPGVDLEYYGNQQQLEYDFVVAPGESVAPIRMAFSGARWVKVDAEGNLVLKSKTGEMVFRKPVAYQTIAGTRREVQSRFRILAGKSAGFWLGAYDRSTPLVIDPVLVYATLLGGNGLGGNQYGDAALAAATDSQGNAYVTGYTDSSDFPVSSSYDGNYNSEFGMAFVSKINASGSAFLYSTFLGGTWQDTGQSIAADSSGNAYVAGGTRSSDFPVVNAIQSSAKVQVGQWTGFVTKINPSGQALVYSTYLGGSGEDYANAIAVDPSGNAYVGGYTSSKDFPTYNPLQAINKATTTNPLTGFVSKINPGGTAFVYSTYLGGSYADNIYGIAADSAGNAYVAGQALSSDFPVFNALQSKFVGTAGLSAAPFLSKIKPDGSGFVYSTYVGGGVEAPDGAGDSAYAVAADSNGDAYIVGEVLSTLDLPLVNALQTGLGTLGYGAFLSKVNPEGSAFVYSTFIGDTNGASGVAVDSNENVYVTGQQYCPWDLPVPVNPIGTCATNGPPVNPNVVIEAFIYEVAADGSGFTFASPYGGGGEYGFGIAVDPSGNVYVAGQTKYATAFSVVNALDKTAEGQQEGFLLKIDMSTSAPAAATPVISPSTGSYTTSQTVSISDTTPNATIYYTKNGTTPTISSAQYTGTFTVSSTETVEAIAFATGYSTSAVATEVITIEAPAATPVIAPAAGTYTSAQTVTISDTTAGATIYYSTNGTTPTTSSTKYNGPITVSSTETIEAIAAASGYSNSAVATAAYTINIPVAATPTFAPAAGTYSSPRTVTISDGTTGATIYYTTNGTTPTTSSTVYSGPITVSSSETIEAIAAASGYSNSAVATAAYTINIPVAATPTFAPGAGTYTSAQTVTISDGTTGATIYYTTNGTTPTTSSTVYSGPITVSSSETIEAIAAASGYSNSAAASAMYTIAAPSFTISASPASVSVAQGNSGTSTITVTAVGGFFGSVTLSASGLPSGVTASFAAGSVAGTQLLTLAAGNSAQVTSTPVTVTVTGTSGGLIANTSIAVSIVAEPSFTGVSGGTTPITVTPGATTGNTGTVSVVGTNGFSGVVTLSCSVTTSMANVNDMPTCSLNPTSLSISGATAQTSTLTASTTAASSAKNEMPKLLWPSTGGPALAVVVILVLPRRPRNWLAMFGMLVVFAALSLVGCGSGGNRVVGGGNPGTSAGSYTITVTGTSGTITAMVGTVALTVQ